MFSKSLDEKNTVTNGTDEYVDLTEGIFNPDADMTQTYSIYRVPEQYQMRPDLVSCALYGTTDYTEMILKYSAIQNPFAIEKDDLVYSVSINGIYNPIKTNDDKSKNKTFDAVKNYHKYIDKSKVPESDSDKNTYTGTEANISENGDTGVTVENGRIYFGSRDFKISAGLNVSNGKVYMNMDEATTSVLDLQNGQTISQTSNPDGTVSTVVNDLITGKVTKVVEPVCNCKTNAVQLGDALTKIK